MCHIIALPTLVHTAITAGDNVQLNILDVPIGIQIGRHEPLVPGALPTAAASNHNSRDVGCKPVPRCLYNGVVIVASKVYRADVWSPKRPGDPDRGRVASL